MSAIWMIQFWKIFQVLTHQIAKFVIEKSLKNTPEIAEFPNEIIDLGLLCGASRTGALPFLFGNNQDVVEK